MVRRMGWSVSLCAAAALAGSTASAGTVITYEDLAEGGYGTSLTHQGVTYRDVNLFGGVFPDGGTFTSDDLGNHVLVERATFFYNDFAGYGSPNNSLTFGNTFIPGDNLSIGALSSVWMDLDAPASEASLHLAYYENGPWGGIEYRLEALRNGSVVASDSFVISDDGGRDNPTWSILSVSGEEFDTLHLFAQFNGQYSAPRGMIDNLTIVSVPEPAAFVLLAAALPFALRRGR
jgi:hypothetical protein